MTQLHRLPDLNRKADGELVAPTPQGAQFHREGVDALVLTGDLLDERASLPDEGLRGPGEDTDSRRSEQGANDELNGLRLFCGHGITRD
ncbi:hypothetical protein LXT21_00705 [Myxococcus sp. K38C18041901]|uniref:hypothetical protein n=1 Tax=Myxococcus guangdongensis TaxID=2906760 RepID=UPI0020A7493A|nr:hypothetical protein [Myxococcus guangdongensis]MCP3057290.1 hypothetical protein [Myxococcus guangdongensis]